MNGRVTIYQEVLDHLRQEASLRSPGSLMPTQADVIRSTSANGVQTVTNAYRALSEEGLVIRSGRRYIVNPSRIVHSEPDNPKVRDIKRLLSKMKASMDQADLYRVQIERELSAIS